MTELVTITVNSGTTAGSFNVYTLHYDEFGFPDPNTYYAVELNVPLDWLLTGRTYYFDSPEERAYAIVLVNNADNNMGCVTGQTIHYFSNVKLQNNFDTNVGNLQITGAAFGSNIFLDFPGQDDGSASYNFINTEVPVVDTASITIHNNELVNFLYYELTIIDSNSVSFVTSGSIPAETDVTIILTGTTLSPDKLFTITLTVDVPEHYGALYNWYAATYSVGGASIAPAGWHVPNNAEYSTLWKYLDGTATDDFSLLAGGYLKESGTSHWRTPNTGADNSSLFTALGSGWRDWLGGFSYGVIGYDMYLHTSDEWVSGGRGNGLYLSYNNPYASGNDFGSGELTLKAYGGSIRCLLDGIDPADPGTVTDIDGNIYLTVKIGTQVWMAENLKVTHYNNAGVIDYSDNFNSYSVGALGGQGLWVDQEGGNSHNLPVVDESGNKILVSGSAQYYNYMAKLPNQTWMELTNFQVGIKLVTWPVPVIEYPDPGSQYTAIFQYGNGYMTNNSYLQGTLTRYCKFDYADWNTDNAFSITRDTPYEDGDTFSWEIINGKGLRFYVNGVIDVLMNTLVWEGYGGQTVFGSAGVFSMANNYVWSVGYSDNIIFYATGEGIKLDNLVFKMGSSNVIPIITDNTLWAADTAGARCAYNNNWNNV